MTTLVNGRWIPPCESSFLNDGWPMIALCQNEVAYARLPAEHLAQLTIDNLDECLSDWLDTLPRERVAGTMIRYPWELLDHNAVQIVADYETLDEEAQGLYPVQAHVIGSIDRLHLDALAHLDPCVVFDTTNGPIVVAANARIEAFSHLQGPCFIGEGTHILGAKIRGRTSIGPGCRVGGVVEASIMLGNCNIGHEVRIGPQRAGRGREPRSRHTHSNASSRSFARPHHHERNAIRYIADNLRQHPRRSCHDIARCVAQLRDRRGATRDALAYRPTDAEHCFRPIQALAPTGCSCNPRKPQRSSRAATAKDMVQNYFPDSRTFSLTRSFKILYAFSVKAG